MGLCFSATDSSEDVPENTKKEKAQSNRVEEKMREEHQDDQAVHKLLLLGAGESGKSTLFKQMIQIYGKGFNESDKKIYLPFIYSHVVSIIKELVRQSDVLPQKGFSKCRVTTPASVVAMRYINETRYVEGTLPSELAVHIKQLWSDEAIRLTFSYRNMYQLNDSAEYFLDQIDTLVKPGYLPVEDDILRVRVRTSGIIEHDFVMDKNKFKLVDVGGQRNERKKWIHCFENVTGVVFVVDIASYDTNLYEDEKVNRMEEALNLFENICNSRWFRDMSMILFLNKSDLFREKIKRSPLTIAFPEYTGDNSFEATTTFIEQEFLKRNHYKKPVYCHITCATDTKLMSVLFNAVKDIVVREALTKAGLV